MSQITDDKYIIFDAGFDRIVVNRNTGNTVVFICPNCERKYIDEVYYCEYCGVEINE